MAEKKDYMLIMSFEEAEKDFSNFFSSLFRWCEDPEIWENTVELGNELKYFLDDSNLDHVPKIEKALNFIIIKMSNTKDTNLLIHVATLNKMQKKIRVGMENHKLYFTP